MWRTFLSAHHIDEADKYLAPEYHQHNPNAETGLGGREAEFSAQKLEELRVPEDHIEGLVSIVASATWSPWPSCATARTRTARRTPRPGSTCSASRTARSSSTGIPQRNPETQSDARYWRWGNWRPVEALFPAAGASRRGRPTSTASVDLGPHLLDLAERLAERVALGAQSRRFDRVAGAPGICSLLLGRR